MRSGLPHVGCVAGAASVWKRDSGNGDVKTFESTATVQVTDRPFGIFALAANQATPPPGPTGPGPGPTGPSGPTGGTTGPTLPGIPDPPVRPNAPVLTAPRNGEAFYGRQRPVLERPLLRGRTVGSEPVSRSRVPIPCPRACRGDPSTSSGYRGPFDRLRVAG